MIDELIAIGCYYYASKSTVVDLLSRITWSIVSRMVYDSVKTPINSSNFRILPRMRSITGIPVYNRPGSMISFWYIPSIHSKYMVDDKRMNPAFYSTNRYGPIAVTECEVKEILSHPPFEKFRDVVLTQQEVDISLHSESSTIFCMDSSDMRCLAVYLSTHFDVVYLDMKNVKKYYSGANECCTLLSGEDNVKVVIIDGLLGLEQPECVVDDIFRTLGGYTTKVIVTDVLFRDSIGFDLGCDSISKRLGVYHSRKIDRNVVMSGPTTTINFSKICKICSNAVCWCNSVCKWCGARDTFCECKICFTCKRPISDCSCSRICGECELFKGYCRCKCRCKNTIRGCTCTYHSDRSFCYTCEVDMIKCDCDRCRHCGQHHPGAWCKIINYTYCRWCSKFYPDCGCDKEGVLPREK